jgi:hypothetical protein
MEKEIMMISAVAEIFTYNKTVRSIERERALQHIARFIEQKRGINPITKIGMMAAASRAVELIEQNRNIKDKEAIKVIMQEIPAMLVRIENE